VHAGTATVDALERALLEAGADVHVGCSGPQGSVRELPGGLDAAREALEAAERFDRRMRARRHPDLGPLRFLVAAPESELRAFADDVLGPLERIEAGADGPLHATLVALLATGLNVAATARNGGWHYNTVRYRLRRLRELLGPFGEDGALLHALSLALLLRRELGDAPPTAHHGA
jgi:purine catabolism regulator